MIEQKLIHRLRGHLAPTVIKCLIQFTYEGKEVYEEFIPLLKKKKYYLSKSY